MTRKEYVAKTAEKAGVSQKEADAVLKAFAEVTVEALKKGDSVSVPALGTFKVIEKAERIARNPITGTAIKVAAHAAPKFIAAAALKSILKKD